MSALAYHNTWTTYATWLPGDERGWVKAGTWGVQPADPQLRQRAQERMVEEALEQRLLVEQTVRHHFTKRGWLLHAVNARTNHVHVVVTAERDPEDVRDQLKGWCSRKLSDQAGLTNAVAKKAGRRCWFTEGGDIEVIENDEYLENAIRYVIEGQ